MVLNISFRQERDNEYDRFAVCGLEREEAGECGSGKQEENLVENENEGDTVVIID